MPSKETAPKGPPLPTRLIAAAKLEQVRIRRWECVAPTPESPADSAPPPQHRTRAFLLSRSEGAVTFAVGLRVSDPPDAVTADGARLWIEIERELTYSGMPADVSDEELHSFAGTNGIFNAWPFLRADVHEACLRLGWRPWVLPLHRMTARTPERRRKPDAEPPP